MSLGYGAIAQLEMMDEEIIFYKYCCFNLNEEQSRACMNFFDGEIWIARDSLKCGEHYIKRIRKANGKKVFIEKIRNIDVDYVKLFSQKKIEVINASGTWKVDNDGNDIMALKLIFKIFDEYQITCKLPKKTSIVN